MIKSVVNKLLMFIYFIVGALILEAVTFYILDFSGMPTYFWYNFCLILFVALLIYTIPNYTAQYVIYTIILFVQTIFAYINYSLSHIYGDMFSFDMMNLAREAGTAIATSFVYFAIILQLLSVFAMIAIIGGIFLKKCRTDKLNVKQHFSIYNVIILIALECFSLGYFVDRRIYFNSTAKITDENYIQSDSFAMNTQFMKNVSYEKFGTYGYFANILIRQIRGYDDDFKAATMAYFNAGNMYDGTFVVDGEIKDNGVFGIDKDENGNRNNVIVIMMESLEWFGFGDGTYDPNFNNLSYELTPNVYSLIYGEDYLTDTDNSNLDNDAIVAKNFFAKSKTNISEGFGIIGSYPVGETLLSVVKEKELTYSMPHILKDMGYTTTYLHSNEIGFYDRGETHHRLGFKNVVGKDGVKVNGENVYDDEDLKWNHWDNEQDFVKYTMDYFIPRNYKEKPFYSFYLNVSSHGPYKYHEADKDCLRYLDYVVYGADDCVVNSHGNWVVDKTKDEDQLTYTNWYQNVLDSYYETDPALCEELIYYQCGVVGLDAAIGELVKELNARTYDDGTKLIDRTTLLLYSDHNAYYDKMSHRVKDLNPDDISSAELNTIPMILVSPGIKKYNAQQTESDKKLINNYRFTSAYDIVPTLFDLLGVKFNENLYLGNSLFRPSDYIYELNNKVYDMRVYYSNTGGMFSKDIYTYDFTDFYNTNYADERKFNNREIQDLFQAECNNVLRKVNFIYIFNHYNLFTKLDKIYEIEKI
jgi:phosphoglycerol transferase MdoB-like AlkP superfamily enzyme